MPKSEGKKREKPCITLDEYLALYWSEVTAAPEPPRQIGKMEATFDALSNDGGVFVLPAIVASLATVTLSALRTIPGAIALEGQGGFGRLFGYTAPIALEMMLFVVPGINTARKGKRHFDKWATFTAVLLSAVLILSLAVVSLRGSPADVFGVRVWQIVYGIVFAIQVVGVIALSLLGGHIFGIAVNIVGYAWTAHRRSNAQAYQEYRDALAAWKARGISSYEAKLRSGNLPCHLVARGEEDEDESSGSHANMSVAQMVRMYLQQNNINPNDASAADIAAALNLRGKTDAVRQALHRMRKQA